ncbi:FosX/FosE/FosI family fosfomycin resistance hydrolase [Rhizobium rhizoryzae]|uniref:Catechol 2,3-dioxygenase-like lactoylglutathione lyase family enzyme n=1 Tax=Rhizobium rhizoryzae TaxID=451876 RepID=A0A7W6LG61_9HYPH|nr:FosX/FosE/FosI family fosfomycin resistance hydrolase [Rhizobium rhizoryzae]MBB4143784.1 catechol 2,3-dioxygenase-like lactoylglutathione lyase family enzyme [Rhizobium rhizoryzae]
MQALSHITFVVSDLDRMEKIVTRVLKGRKVYDSGETSFSLSRERFFLIGAEPSAVWIAIMEGEGLSHRSYNHVAFRIEPSDMDERLKAIEDLGLELKDPRSRVEGEGQSIYFYDDDNHLFELHTGTLEERLKRYAAPEADV